MDVFIVGRFVREIPGGLSKVFWEKYGVYKTAEEAILASIEAVADFGENVIWSPTITRYDSDTGKACWYEPAGIGQWGK
jgi:hypothetical protein